MFYRPMTKGQKRIQAWERAGSPRTAWEQGDEDARLSKRAARLDDEEYIAGYEARLVGLWENIAPLIPLMQERDPNFKLADHLKIRETK